MEMTKGSTRIMQRVDQLAVYSAMKDGLSRSYLTPEHKRAHSRLAKWMREAGLKTWQDSAGNQWGRKESANPVRPALIIGSHSDTVADAGKYDGILGIIMGIEALSFLSETELPFHIDVVAFADEEGLRFGTGLIGSSAVAGCFQPSWLEIRDGHGISMREAMEDFGLHPADIGKDSRSPKDTMAYLEVHIEQGPVLERYDLPVGVVSGIAGAQRYQLELRGEAGHAGTVPLTMRKDALCGAAEMIGAVERCAKENHIVATIGRCDVIPGSINVIPSDVHFTLDIRSQCQKTLETCSESLLSELFEIANRRQLQLNSSRIYQVQAVLCSENLKLGWRKVVEKHTEQDAYQLPSNAGHDAMVMAGIADMGMLFVRCRKGISHNPGEQIRTDDVTIALNCLIDMISLIAEKVELLFRGKDSV